MESNQDQLSIPKETRRHFLTRTAIGGILSLRTLRGQGQETPTIPGVEAGEPTKLLALRNVTVIEGTGKPAMRGMTVLINGNRIQSVGATGRVAVPQDAKAIDVEGKFLIPGLWDMHGHVSKEMLPLFVANGVTGVRIMGGVPPYHQDLRTEIVGGKRLGPSLVIASPALDGPGSDPNPYPPWRIVSNAEQGRMAVRRSIQEGADCIKVYELLSRESYFAIADEANKARIPFGGHVPRTITPAECSAAGQKSIEHLFGMERACTDGYEAWRQAMIQAKEPAKVPMMDAHMRAETFSESRAAAIASVFRKNHTWVCPTHTTMFGLAGDPSLTQNPRLKYVSREMRTTWAAGLARRLNDPNLPIVRRFNENCVKVLSAMRKAGVGILTGTDTPTQFCLPGFGVHDELRFLVSSAGLTPMEALRAATYHPAAFLGKLDSLGTVAHGKLAELVLLEANPLDDITNTQKLNMVITSGRVYRKPALEAILNAVEAVAAQN